MGPSSSPRGPLQGPAGPSLLGVPIGPARTQSLPLLGPREGGVTLWVLASGLPGSASAGWASAGWLACYAFGWILAWISAWISASGLIWLDSGLASAWIWLDFAWISA